MAEKISMIIVLVDLDCHKCYNKIRKILCQLQDCWSIRTISFDDKSKTITIVGPFDPQRLACKLRCKGGKVIRDIHIVDNGGGRPPQKMAEPPSLLPVKNGKQKHKGKPPPPPAADEPPPPQPAPAPEPEPVHEMPPPQSPAHHAPPDREMSAMVPAFVEEHPKAKPAELEPPPMSPPRKEKPPMDMHMPMPMPMPASPLPPPPVKERSPPRPLMPARPCEQPPVEYVIPTVEIPSWPAPTVGPCGCPCCAPCYQGYYEGCRCCSCGRAYAPAPAACGGYRGCRTFSDEDPTAACTVM